MMQSFRRTDLFTFSAYLILAAISASGILEIERITLRWLALLLLVVFGVLLNRYPHPLARPPHTWRANLLIGAQTILVVVLIQFTDAGNAFIFLFFLLSAAVMRYNTLRMGLVWIAGFLLITGWFFSQSEGVNQVLRVISIYAGGFGFMGIMTHALHQSSMAQAQNVRLLTELQAKNQQLEEYAAQVEKLAAVEERNRLAREVHDTIGHRLTAAAVQIEAAQRLIPVDADKAANLAGAGREQVREALQELRGVVGRLREPIEAELPLEQAVRRLAANFESATGLIITLEMPKEPCALNATQRLTLYRATQEGLTNIQRHAHATHAWVRLVCTPARIELSVRDNGNGVQESSQAGFGLRGLAERAAQLGGACTLKPAAEGGALLEISLPVQPQGEDKEKA
jgi:signal transduction histidine kinase